MGLSKLILRISLKLVDLFTFWMKPQKGRITFISLTSDRLVSDFALINEALKKDGRYEIHYDLLKFKKNLWGDFLYYLNCLRQLTEIKRSQLVIINDNNYVISTMKPACTKVLQVWHAAGAVKKFGNQIKRQYPVKNYDRILCSSDYWKTCYSEAFGTPRENVVSTGMCRIDELLEHKKLDDFYEKYPQLKGKKILLYAPTFRGNIIDGMYKADLDVKALMDQLDEDWVLVSKLHPLLQESMEAHERTLDLSGEDLYTLMHASTAMISDYSSVIFDYSLLKKPLISYVPDLEKYEETIGLNIPYRIDFPGAITRNEAQLANAVRDLDHYDYEKLEKFQKKYITHADGKNTHRVAKVIEELVN